MKDIVQFIRNRVSHSALIKPAPTQDEWLDILAAGSRAADHGCLKTWRYRIYQGDSLDQLGECYWRHAQSDVPDIPLSKRDSFIRKAHRAPAVLLVYAALEEHPSIPMIEQTMSVAAATQQILLGLSAQGYGAMWRTGPVAHTELTKSLLGLEQKNQIIGFIYVGTPKNQKEVSKEVDLDGRVEWFN